MLLDNLNVLFCQLRDPGEIARCDSLRVHQLTTNTQANRSSFQELGSSGEVNAAGRHELHLWEWSAKCFEERRANNLRRKHFYYIRSGLPCGHNFSWSECSGHYQFIVSPTDLDHIEIQAGGNDKLRPREQGRSRGFGIEYRSGPKQHSIAKFPARLADDIECIRNREGDLGDDYAAFR